VKWEALTLGDVKSIEPGWEPPIEAGSMSEDFKKIRQMLLHEFNRLAESQFIDKADIDLHFSIAVYDTLNKYGFGLRQASDHEIWLYINLKVIPDIVFKRFDNQLKNDWLFGVTKARIWSRALWWLVHLALQDKDPDYQKTKAILKDITSDISQVTDRAGKEGVRVDLQRKILFYYSRIPKDKKRRIEGRGTLLSRILQLSIMRLKVVEPGLCDGGEDIFVKKLFAYFGFEFKE
jgi:hypothetical protein